MRFVHFGLRFLRNGLRIPCFLRLNTHCTTSQLTLFMSDISDSMPRHVSPTARAIDKLWRQLIGPGHSMTGHAVENLLVEYFSANRRKALLDRVHARVCRRHRQKIRRSSTQMSVRTLHDPIKLVQLILDMGATKTSYRNLVGFCSACNKYSGIN